MIRHEWITDFGTFDLTNPNGDGYYDAVVLTNQGLEGMGNPPVQRFSSQSPLLDGQIDKGWRAEPRKVFWPIVINTNTDLFSWDGQQFGWWRTMRPTVSGTWRVTKDNGTYRDLLIRYVSDGGSVYDVDPSLTGVESHGIEMVADDPWWRGPEVSETFQTAEDSLPFYAITADRVFNLMSSNTVANATIANPGDVAVWPKYRFDGPITSFIIGFQAMFSPTIEAVYDLPAGDWLILDTDPRVQTMTRYFSGGGSLDVTDELDKAAFRGVAANGSTDFYVTLNGGGSLTISIIPRYFRAV